MNKWEQFEYILKQVLPSYIHHTRLSCNVELNQAHYYGKFEYKWTLEIKKDCGLYEEIRNISRFCDINWDDMFWSTQYMKLVSYVDTNEKITPVYW